MANVIEKAAQDDPKALRKQVADLKRRLANLNEGDLVEMTRLIAENAALTRDVELLRGDLAEARARQPEPVEVPVLPIETVDDLRKIVSMMRDVASGVSDALLRTKAQPTVRSAVAPMQAAAPLNLGPSRRQPPARPVANLAGDLAAELRRRIDGTAPPLKAGARNMVAVLARQHPQKITRAQLATLAKLKVTGGTFTTYLSAIKRAGLIVEDDKYVTLTDAGFAYTGSSSDLPITAGELRDTWRGVLKAGARNMLDVLLDRHPDPITRQELADALDRPLEVTGGTFTTYLSTLRRNGLVDETSDGIRAADVFFSGAASERDACPNDPPAVGVGDRRRRQTGREPDLADHVPRHGRDPRRQGHG